VLQSSLQSGSHVPLPQFDTHAPPSQCVHAAHPQSDAQVLQFSPQAGSHVPLPQFDTHDPLSQWVHAAQPQSDGQVVQFSPHAASHVPLPQFDTHDPATQCVHAPQPQSDGQLLQFSQMGSQVPLPQAETHAPLTHICVHGAQPQSPGQVLQFSHAGLHVPSPQVDWQTPPTHACVHGVQPQSLGQVLQSSSQLLSHDPLPQTSWHTLVLVIVQTIFCAWVLTEIVREVQFVQLPTGVGVRSHVPSPCEEQVMSLKQLMDAFPVQRPATSKQAMFVWYSPRLVPVPAVSPTEWLPGVTMTCPVQSPSFASANCVVPST